MKQNKIAKHGLWVLVLGFALSACWGKKEEEAAPAGEAVSADAPPAMESTEAPPAEAPADAPAAEGEQK